MGRMGRNACPITCNPDDRQELEQLAGSRTESKQMVERAQIVLGCLAGQRVKEVARACRTRPNTVIKWRQRFAQHGLAGLRDAPRPGAKPVYGEEFRNRVLSLLEQPPPAGQACWDGPAVATALNGSVHAVWRVLRYEGICLQRQRSWCVSTDKEFVAKAADIVGLYLNPPQNALVISVDEKPSIQALERKTGYVETDSGRSCAATKAPTNVTGRSTSLRLWKWLPGKSRLPSPNSSGGRSSCSSWTGCWRTVPRSRNCT